MGFDNIWQNDGIGIAVTGMTIVFAALTLISVFIRLLPGTLKTLGFVLSHEPKRPPTARTRPAGDDEVAAAIGFVLHQVEQSKKQAR